MIAVIDGCGTNIASLLFALERLGKQATLTTDPAVIQQARHVILPGVGHAAYAMRQLQASGLIEIIKNLRQPTLGICLGMQLLYASSEEGDTVGLNIINEKIKKIPADQLIVPHMGWNQLQFAKNSRLFQGIAQSAYCYFVHSYYAPVNDNTIAITDYGVAITAAANKDNFYAVQFHPEKSGKIGLQILANFLELT